MARERSRTAKIGKTSVDDAEPEEARYTLWDTELKGFGVRVAPAGTKTYMVRYRAGGGRKGTLRQQVIGRHGTLTADQARKEAKRVLGAVTLGDDPQEAKAKERAELTVAELCDLYMKEGVATKKASTLAIDKIRIARHIKPLLGKLRVSKVERRDVDHFMRDVASGKTKVEATPHTRGGKAAASRSVGLLSGIFAFAVDRKLCKTNPAAGIKRFKDNRRERFLSAAEMGALGDALDALQLEGMDKSHVTIMRLLALTGARKSEISTLRWREYDNERGLLRLEDSKTGAKVMQLGAAALTLLAEVDHGKSDYVFPDPRDRNLPIRGLDWAWVRVRKRAGLPEVRIHDLRHSFASVGLAGGQALPLIGKLLGHAHVGTTARYAHLADDPVKAAADRISNAVDAAMGRVSGKPADGSARKAGT
jgi:integrase